MQKQSVPTKSVEDYIRDFPKSTQVLLRKIRATVRQLAPKAEESMSYGMIGYKLHAKPLVYFGGWKNHVGFYPIPSGIKAFETELSKFNRAKGSVQFPLDKPLPLSLIKKIIQFRVKENAKQQKSRVVR
jgi:uncharacterized protein YdhG (YjbR/CyaY superfamily)